MTPICMLIFYSISSGGENCACVSGRVEVRSFFSTIAFFIIILDLGAHIGLD